MCLIASGSEVNLALEISTLLEIHMISARVISMPSINLFNKLKKEQKEKILPPNMKKVVLELSSCESYYKFLNTDDLVFNVPNYMKSGNKQDIISKLSYTPDTILNSIINSIK